MGSPGPTGARTSLIVARNGTPGRYYAGELPPFGEWVELTVRAEDVGLVGQTIDGMAFNMFDGARSLGAGWILYWRRERIDWYETRGSAGFYPA